MYAFDEDGNIIKELRPFIKNKESIINPNNSYSGPIIILYSPNISYYIASLIKHFYQQSNSNKLCIDAGGRNFGIDGSVYVLTKDIIEFINAELRGYK